MPDGMLRALGRTLHLHIAQVRVHLAIFPHALPVPGHIGRAHVGIEDDRAAPARLAPVLPAVGFDDTVKVVPEGRKRGTLFHGLQQALLEVGQQGVIGGPGHHESLGVHLRGQVPVGRDRHAHLAPEMGDGILKRPTAETHLTFRHRCPPHH